VFKQEFISNTLTGGRYLPEFDYPLSSRLQGTDYINRTSFKFPLVFLSQLVHNQEKWAP